MGKVKVFFEDVKKFPIDRTVLALHLNGLVKDEELKIGDISIIFCSDEYLLDINREHLNHDYYTDIVTFDYSDGNLVSGDLLISVDRVKENAGVYGESFVKELFRVIFHGVLHLTGYKDHDEIAKKVMREKEDYYLRKLGWEE